MLHIMWQALSNGLRCTSTALRNSFAKLTNRQPPNALDDKSRYPNGSYTNRCAFPINARRLTGDDILSCCGFATVRLRCNG